MIAIRQHLLPEFFEASDLRELDTAEYEELEGFHQEGEAGSNLGSCRSSIDAEMLDELTTNRGELKHRTVSNREERHHQVK